MEDGSETPTMRSAGVEGVDLKVQAAEKAAGEVMESEELRGKEEG